MMEIIFQPILYNSDYSNKKLIQYKKLSITYFFILLYLDFYLYYETLLLLLLLSLLPLSCMVVPKRKLANKISSAYIFFTINYMTFNVIYENININTLRERSSISRPNSSRASSILSITSSVSYHAMIK